MDTLAPIGRDLTRGPIRAALSCGSGSRRFASPDNLPSKMADAHFARRQLPTTRTALLRTGIGTTVGMKNDIGRLASEVSGSGKLMDLSIE
jgi:hypothetical protein